MKPTPIPRQRWELAALVGVLLLAAGLRLGAPGITEFKRDEANMAQKALDLVHGREFPLLGLSSSINVPNPPVSVYLFALPFAASDNPVVAVLFVGLLNVIAVALTWVLARRYYGPVAALVAGLLYAASPWAAIYSRKIWAQDLLPPFVVATVFTGLLGYGENKRWARRVHWPLLAITVQIHYGAFPLVPLSLLMLALWGRRDSRDQWRDLAVGLALAALTALPALAGAYRDNWLSPDTFRDRVETNPDHNRVISTTALDAAWLTVAGTDIHSLAGPDAYRDYLDSVPDAYPLFRLVPLGTVLAAGWLLWRTARDRSLRQRPHLVLMVWLVLPVIIFTWEWAEAVPHYMIPLMPAAYILCGAGIAAVAQAKRSTIRKTAPILGIGVIGIAALQVVLFVRLLDFVDTHPTRNGFGTPLHTLLDVREAILDREPDDVLVLSDQELAPFDEIPAVWGALLEPVPQVRFVDRTRSAVIPAGAAWELVYGSPHMPALVECYSDPADTVTFERRPGESPLVLNPILPDQCAVDVTDIEPVHFANGATLTGYVIGTSVKGVL
ncbi:MAG: glycosyltransferase family 39 protein, partial [Anaerolineae bacterium]|nr:glycosyltransferase family 39 protein [Anaerolineae bacterium]